MVNHGKDVKIFACNSNPQLAAKIAAKPFVNFFKFVYHSSSIILLLSSLNKHL